MNDINACEEKIIPLKTAPYQTDELTPRVTRPITLAVGAINEHFKTGAIPLYFNALVDGTT